MAVLAQGSAPLVVRPFLLGSAVMLIASFVHPVYGLAPLLGTMLLAWGSYLGLLFRDGPRRIEQEPRCLVSPTDGRLTLIQRERAVARRPSEFEVDQAGADPESGVWVPLSDEPPSVEDELRWEPHPDGDVWRMRIEVGRMDVQVHRSPAEGIVRKAELRLPATPRSQSHPQRLRWVLHVDGALVEVTAHLRRPRLATVPYAFEGANLRRGQRLALHASASWIDVRVPVNRWTPAIDLLEAWSSTKREEVVAGQSIVFQPMDEEGE